jgi:dihydrofolate synthase/folylpolyglutamate synthase
MALAAAERFAGVPLDPAPAAALAIPGRLERRAERPFELWDGAHNGAGVSYLLARLPPARYTLVASILADKDAEAMLAALASAGDTLVATASRNPRALPVAELAALAAPHFARVEAVARPEAALVRARALAGEDGAVLVTGSLYLLAELSRVA